MNNTTTEQGMSEEKIEYTEYLRYVASAHNGRVQDMVETLIRRLRAGGLSIQRANARFDEILERWAD